jgi:rhodanese-related sulfurtransferase
MPTAVDTFEVAKLLADGAQLVDVLPAETFANEHIPGAVSIPMAEIASAPERLDPTRSVIVYCYDYQCDLSGRAAVRLESLGFSQVYDYVASKVAWFAEGLPSEGLLDDGGRAISRVHRDVPVVAETATMEQVAAAIGDWEIAVVTASDDIVVGVVRREAVDLNPDLAVATMMQPAPPTVRPSISLKELAESMDRNGELHLLVTTLHGKLIGLIRRHDLDRA